MRIGILKTDSVRRQWVDEYGEYPDMFIALFSKLMQSADLCSPLSFTVYDVQEGEYPEHIDVEDAYLITGSKSSAYDEDDWIAALKDFVRALASAKKKLVGICFGHQLIAQALGGSVAKAEQGWGIGRHRYAFSEEASPWFIAREGGSNGDQHDSAGERAIHLLASHQDQVISLPPQATILASSEFCPVAAMRLGDYAVSFQGHPEFLPDYARALMDHRSDLYAADLYAEARASLHLPTDHEDVARGIINFLMAES